MRNILQFVVFFGLHQKFSIAVGETQKLGKNISHRINKTKSLQIAALWGCTWAKHRFGLIAMRRHANMLIITMLHKQF